VQYRSGTAGRSLVDMKTNRPANSLEALKERRTHRCNFRGVAAHHAIGIEPDLEPEKRRLLELAVNEAEALACQTGVPELVLLTLAEEKVRATRQWLARQSELKSRSYGREQWQLAA
jgi:hypothetical protein